MATEPPVGLDHAQNILMAAEFSLAVEDLRNARVWGL